MMHLYKLIWPLMGALALGSCESTRDALEFGDAADPNPGACPRAFALYDAARYVEILGEEKFQNVGFTGEFEDVRSLCRYYGDRPIRASLELDLGLGKGPAAEGDIHQYTYFVAVTRNNGEVIHKERFAVTGDFSKNNDRVLITERLDNIVIPRAGENVSGSNFEIIAGFELNPEQIEFNRQGKRFRVSAGESRNN